MDMNLIHIIALKENRIFDLKKENERLKSSIKTIIQLTSCDDTWDFANRVLQGKEKLELPYRFNRV